MDGLGKTIEKTAEDIGNMRKEFAQHMESVPSIYIKPQTFMPGEVYPGIVACDTRRIMPQTEGNFKVVISIDGEDHEFTFSRSFTYIKKRKI